MTALTAWPALATLGAILGCLYLSRVAWGFRTEPGGRYFVGMAGAMTVIALLNWLGFLVFTPALREAVEVGIFVAGTVASVLWFTFGLVYTGRDDVVRSRPYDVLVGVALLFVALLSTNPLHHLLWRDFQVVESLGVAGTSYALGPGMLALYGLAGLLILAPVVPLLQTLLSYGPLYRSQAAALAVTPLPVALALTAYVFDLGPASAVSFLGFSMLPHMLLDVYALFWGDMFVFHPATRRIGENAAIDEVGTPVLIVDDAGRIINLNGVAEQRFGIEKYDVLGQSVSSVVEGDVVDPEDPGESVSLLVGDEWREYDVTSTPLQDESGRRIGYTVTLHDVTAERQRKQRLQVLNRVLRHNLRNDLSVVTSSVEAIRAKSEDEQVDELSATVVSTCRDLVDLGEEARLLDDVLGDGEPSREPVDVDRLFERVADDLRGEWPEGRIVVEGGTGATVETDPRLLSETLAAAVENGLEHSDAGEPTVWLSTRDDGDVTELRVRDNGPGIPDHERAVVEAGRETDLEHGSGLGLWLIAWCVRRLGGKVSFEVDGGTTVVVRLPRRTRDAGGERSGGRTTAAPGDG